MVSIQKAKQGFSLRQKSRLNKQNDREKLGLIVAGTCVGFLLIVMWNSMGLGGGTSGALLSSSRTPLTVLRANPHPHLQMMHAPMPDTFNAIALDILNTLQCDQLFNETKQNNYYGMNNNKNQGFEDDERRHRRRLDEQHGDDGGFQQSEEEEDDANRHGDNGDDDDAEEERADGRDADGRDGGDDFLSGDFTGDFWTVTAKHLFCVAASESPPETVTSVLQCDAAGTKRKALLNLWSSARAQIQREDILLKILSLAREQSNQVLLDKYYHLWAPDGDSGMEYMLATINDEQDTDHEGLRHLSESLGPNKLFVDVGSGMGFTTLAVSNRYPGTKIVSIEPASPNWLLQELNLRCNLEEKVRQQIHVELEGVGPNDSEDESNMMAKLMWRPSATTSTRAWTPSSEHREDDIELVVRLKRLKSILAEADIYDIRTIDVLNVDCEGCEYNLIPALTREEFEAIPTVMGNLHWGFIPDSKKPSSKRGQTTHRRMCEHENIARTAKECCAFPDLPVKSRNPNEVLMQEEDGQNRHFPPHAVTVLDVVTPNLCVDFDKWAADNYLNDIPSDWGWFQLTSEAETA